MRRQGGEARAFETFIHQLAYLLGALCVCRKLAAEGAQQQHIAAHHPTMQQVTSDGDLFS